MLIHPQFIIEEIGLHRTRHGLPLLALAINIKQTPQPEPMGGAGRWGKAAEPDLEESLEIIDMLLDAGLSMYEAIS